MLREMVYNPQLESNCFVWPRGSVCLTQGFNTSLIYCGKLLSSTEVISWFCFLPKYWMNDFEVIHIVAVNEV